MKFIYIQRLARLIFCAPQGERIENPSKLINPYCLSSCYVHIRNAFVTFEMLAKRK